MLNAAAALSLLAPVSSCTEEIRVDIGSETGTYIEFASALTNGHIIRPLTVLLKFKWRI